MRKFKKIENTEHGIKCKICDKKLLYGSIIYQDKNEPTYVECVKCAKIK